MSLEFETTMTKSDATARDIFNDIRANQQRAKFGFGDRVAVVNVDIQQAYTRPDLFPKTSYVTDPNQIGYVNQLSSLARAVDMPVVWTQVAYKSDAGDAGVWGTRTDTEDSLQNIKVGSDRFKLDPRCETKEDVDFIFTKRMPSAFHESPLQSYLIWHKVDTVIVTGGSTSGCVRATAVDSLSRGYKTIVPIECVADKHESYHFANLTDLLLKYADVVDVAEAIAWFEARA